MASPLNDPSTPNDGRVFFRDVKPYAIVDDLDQLRGPAGGIGEDPPGTGVRAAARGHQ